MLNVSSVCPIATLSRDEFVFKDMYPVDFVLEELLLIRINKPSAPCVFLKSRGANMSIAVKI